MREFRTWCKNKNQWETDLIAILPHGGLLHGDVRIYGNAKWKPCDHKTHIIEMYTGLLDKNGKKIFEGDIVFFYYERYEIIFHNGRFAMKHKKIHKHKNIPYPVISNVINRFEIIGNIHE